MQPVMIEIAFKYTTIPWDEIVFTIIYSSTVRNVKLKLVRR